MSDFLNLDIKDKIIDGTPKFNITDNSDGTKNISLANDVTQEGTPLNKANFENMLKYVNNVMGYTVPSYEIKNIDTTISASGGFYSSDISNGTYYYSGNSLNYRITKYEDSDSTMTLYGSSGIVTSMCKLYNYADSSFYMMVYHSSSSSKSGSLYTSDMTINFSNDFNASDITITIPAYYSSSYPATHTISINGINRETITQTSSSQSISIGKAENISSIKIYSSCYNTTSLTSVSNGYIRIDFGKITDEVALPTIYMTSDTSNTIANHIEKIKAPSGTYYGNYLNGKTIDTLLTPNSYYDLIYNGTKYIAYEKN